MFNLLRRGKLHAAEVQLLHRRISMPSLGTYSSTSLSQRISLNQVTVKTSAKGHATKAEDCLAPEVSLQRLCLLLLTFQNDQTDVFACF